MVWAPPDSLSPAALIAWMTVAVFAFHLAMTIFYTPHQALGGGGHVERGLPILAGGRTRAERGRDLGAPLGADLHDEAVVVARDDVALLELTSRVALTAYGALVAHRARCP